MPETNTLDLENVCKRYGAADDPRAVRVLDDVSLSIARGSATAVVGPSGCGKSTLLNLMGALDHPTAGSVRLDGADLGQKAEDELARMRNQAIGFVFQLHHLLPQCTTLENVLIPTLPYARRDDRARLTARAHDLLQRVGLHDRGDHHPGALSGGEQQRVAVVRALINSPTLLLADEPTGSLDRRAADGIADLLVELNERDGVTLVVVTHSMELAGRMTSAYELREGKLHAEACGDKRAGQRDVFSGT